ncbi:uncharacterized protein VTP21DRAFT_1963 [Calcarisporiella thermophila]|uniref:uncharacterized protein n=1 Tax=Calcarisporiella thermophila TaxID=911321 RepID=UPI0037434B1A
MSAPPHPIPSAPLGVPGIPPPVGAPGFPDAPGAAPPPMPNLAPGSMPGYVPPPPIPKQPPCTTPNNTIYINNLNEKIKLETLKKSLETIFNQYGTILSISAKASLRMRGQAFVVFENVESAEKAVKEVQHFPLFGKPMVLQFARMKSDVIAEREGNLEESKRRRIEEKRERELARMKEEAEMKEKLGEGAKAAAPKPVARIPDEYLPPNNILFLQNLPEDTTQETLAGLFQQYYGFKEVRMVPGRKGIAFVEYENEYLSGLAKEALSNYLITPEHPMKVTFARK